MPELRGGDVVTVAKKCWLLALHWVGKVDLGGERGRVELYWQ